MLPANKLSATNAANTIGLAKRTVLATRGVDSQGKHVPIALKTLNCKPGILATSHSMPNMDASMILLHPSCRLVGNSRICFKRTFTPHKLPAHSTNQPTYQFTSQPIISWSPKTQNRMPSNCAPRSTLAQERSHHCDSKRCSRCRPVKQNSEIITAYSIVRFVYLTEGAIS